MNFTTDDDRQQSIWGGNLQTRLPYANVTGSFSTARQYRQGSLSLQGAVVAHRGGVTLGPYVGDTFALIEAPGASGARVMDGQARASIASAMPGTVAGALSLQHRRAEPRGHERQSGARRRPATRRPVRRRHGAPALQHRARSGAIDHRAAAR
ncbi:fimbria/pilus outer membrane usher protein [Serratia ureilytica]